MPHMSPAPHSQHGPSLGSLSSHGHLPLPGFSCDHARLSPRVLLPGIPASLSPLLFHHTYHRNPALWDFLLLPKAAGHHCKVLKVSLPGRTMRICYIIPSFTLADSQAIFTLLASQWPLSLAPRDPRPFSFPPHGTSCSTAVSLLVPPTSLTAECVRCQTHSWDLSSTCAHALGDGMQRHALHDSHTMLPSHF